MTLVCIARKHAEGAATRTFLDCGLYASGAGKGDHLSPGLESRVCLTGCDPVFASLKGPLSQC